MSSSARFGRRKLTSVPSKLGGAAFIPYEFMPIVLGRNLTARDAYLILVPAIIDAGLESVCQPLIDFLTVTVVEPSATALEPLTLKPCLGKLHHVPSPAVISSRREEVLYRDLPGLKHGPSNAGDPYLRDVARAVGDLAVEARSDRDDRQDRRAILDLPKSVRDKFGDRLTDRLLLLCRVKDDELLPLLYHEWAARPKGVSERYVMQQAVDVACAELHLSSFQVTPAHVMAFKNLQFAGGQYFDIGTGLIPFSITPADAQSAAARAMLAADQGRADAFDLGADPESSAITPSDVPCLRNLQGYIPHGWIEAGSQLRSECGLLAALLGTGHPVVRAYTRFLAKYGRLQTRLSLELDHEFGGRLGAPLFNFHVQLAVRNWLFLQIDTMETDIIDPPNFYHGLEVFETSNNLMWAPSISSVPALLTLQVAATSTRAATTHSAAPATRTTSPASLTAPASATGAREPGRMVRNIHRDPRFTANTPFARNVRSRRVVDAIALAGGSPPDVTRGGASGAMCVSWHGKGQCFDNCGRVTDHGTLSVAESTAFHEWCATAYA
jgi:hypothetical protein